MGVLTFGGTTRKGIIRGTGGWGGGVESQKRNLYEIHLTARRNRGGLRLNSKRKNRILRKQFLVERGKVDLSSREVRLHQERRSLGRAKFIYVRSYSQSLWPLVFQLGLGSRTEKPLWFHDAKEDGGGGAQMRIPNASRGGGSRQASKKGSLGPEKKGRV